MNTWPNIIEARLDRLVKGSLRAAVQVLGLYGLNGFSWGMQLEASMDTILAQFWGTMGVAMFPLRMGYPQ